MEENNTCLVQFKYKPSNIKYDKVGIVGGLDILNNWDINNPVLLSYNEKEDIFISNQISLPKIL